ncbi:MAG: HNH endonuclease signature motif containing protein, partial [Dermatophilaceae bacterium]
TIEFDRLAGAVRGAGTTLTGQVLSPQSVRKLACDAAIIPMVLGSQGQPLDVGRTKRLVTPALLAALWARDKGCTFPGCGRPPQWCDAHHVRHWVDGGATSLLNLTLLCAYHPPPRSAGGTPLRPPTRPHRGYHRPRRHLVDLTAQHKIGRISRDRARSSGD